MASSLNPAWTVRLATITYGDGCMVRFTKSGAVYISPAGTFSIRLKSGGLFTLTEKDRTVHNFDSPGRLGGISDRNGSLNRLSYTGTQRIAVTGQDERRPALTTGGRLDESMREATRHVCPTSA